MTHICTTCGYEGKGKKILRGSKAMEVFIWSVLMIPGPFYSAWRRVGISRICMNCGLKTVVPLNSDAGYVMQQKILMEIVSPANKQELAPDTAAPAISANESPPLDPAVRIIPDTPLAHKDTQTKAIDPNEW